MKRHGETGKGFRLRFSVSYDFRNQHERRIPFPDLYRETLDHAAFVDDLGFDTAWLTEHHFLPDGYSPALFPLAAAIALRTRRIRVGTYIVILPLHHAVEIAEQATCIDILSNGRMSLGLGQGGRPVEFQGYNVPTEERRSRMEEGVAVIAGLLREERFTFHGKHYFFDDLGLTPRPVQTPALPIWVAAVSPAAAERAARYKAHLAPFGCRESSVDVWKSKLIESGEDPSSYAVSLLRPVLVTEDQALAERIVAGDVARYGYQQDFSADPRMAAEMGRMAGYMSSGTPLEGGAWIFGPASRVIDELERFIERTSVNEVITWAVPWGMRPSETYPYFERLAKEVLPHFQR